MSAGALIEPVVPAGWKLVPVEPTEDMVVDGFESWPDPFFSSQEEWDKYEAMSGCQQAAHRARLCYAAMLAAAPDLAPSVIDPVGGSNSLESEVARLKRVAFMMSQCVHNLVVANQAAWIEWQHGGGAEVAMTWIHNGLAGPGHVPRGGGTDAQAYFDANVDERMEPEDAKPIGAKP